jgi:hypothetical protein
MEDTLIGKFRFKDIGRNKIEKTVTLTDEYDIFKAVQPHLMSRDLSFEYDPETNEGAVFAGFRQVGTFQKVTQS